MKSKTNIKLPLTAVEKANLRKNKIKIADILDFATDELEVLLNATTLRAKEIYALAEFQTVPSVGIKFAEDLVFLGYYSLNELKNKNGAKLTDEYEKRGGTLQKNEKSFVVKTAIQKTDLKNRGLKY
jgi:Pathogenicity locus